MARNINISQTMKNLAVNYEVLKPNDRLRNPVATILIIEAEASLRTDP